MKPKKARAVVAEMFKTGTSRIWIDPANVQKVSEAMTKEDIRGLIAQNIIKEKKVARQSKRRFLSKKKGRARGQGKRRGTAKARINHKKTWISKVRAQRKKLLEIKKSKAKLKISYRKAYRMVKGGYFRGKKHLEATVAGENK